MRHIIDCQKVGGYLYYIANPEDIDEDKQRNECSIHLPQAILLVKISLKDRILVDEIPSSRNHLTTILEAIKENRTVNITYHPFGHEVCRF